MKRDNLPKYRRGESIDFIITLDSWKDEGISWRELSGVRLNICSEHTHKITGACRLSQHSESDPFTMSARAAGRCLQYPGVYRLMMSGTHEGQKFEISVPAVELVGSDEPPQALSSGAVRLFFYLNGKNYK